MEIGKTVFVGLSGGVDSSVAALRLKNQGYTVVGVFIKVWHPDFMVCNWERERLDAMRVAAHLDIPFLTCDAEREYKDGVADAFINEYLAGRTPNPDILCNQQVKFGAFLRFAKQKGADYIATGHYARRVEGKNGPELHRGVDDNKDQTYFLWTLTNAQLRSSLFPIGDTPKDDIRAEADAAGLPTAVKKDSQGICFLGHIDIPEFLSHYVDLEPGPVLDESGDTIGSHEGALVYTLGQRHGFTLDTTDTGRAPMFVTSKDVAKNTITVETKKPHLETGGTLQLHSTVLREGVTSDQSIETQIRYRQKPFVTEVRSVGNDTLNLLPKVEIERPAVGQSCVLYEGSRCIGGGIIG